jgi:enamine deaminase RidA (YjgF/YER057c/UK114 family)
MRLSLSQTRHTSGRFGSRSATTAVRRGVASPAYGACTTLWLCNAVSSHSIFVESEESTDLNGTVLLERTSRISFHVREAGERQVFLVAFPRSPAEGSEAVCEAYACVAQVLRERKLQIVHERIFGSLSAEPFVMAVRQHALRSCGIHLTNPVSYIQGNPLRGEGFAGTIIHAVSAGGPDDVWTIMDGEHPCGRGWRRNGSTYFVLQNINGKHGSANGNGNRPLQVRHMLDRADRILRENGASYRNVVRTWFYLSHILDWYAAFNKVRNEKYGEFGIMPGPGDKDLLLPASTGIRGDTPSGAAATMDLFAIVGEAGSRPAVEQLTNSSQLDAFRYGSAFSRGALIQESDVSLIEVSGTAAIDQQGRSLYPGDIRSQINCTFDRIETLLGKEGAGLKDIAAATVFIKSPEYAWVFWEMAKDRGLEELPAVCVVADVCREELLFEIDAEAAVVRSERGRHNA